MVDQSIDRSMMCDRCGTVPVGALVSALVL